MLGWVSLKSLMVNYFFLYISYITFNPLIGSHFSMVWNLSWDVSFLLVRICNCTKLGYCYMEPEAHSWKLGMGSTIGILAGIFGFIGKNDMLKLVLLCLYLNIKTSKLSLNFFFFFQFCSWSLLFTESRRRIRGEQQLVERLRVKQCSRVEIKRQVQTLFSTQPRQTDIHGPQHTHLYFVKWFIIIT